MIVKIKDLKYTSEDKWLDGYKIHCGNTVKWHPNYLALTGEIIFLKEWFEYRKLDWLDRMGELIALHNDINKNGQKEPIKIYKDMRINNGHKRASVMLYLGYEEINAKIVPDDYKL